MKQRITLFCVAMIITCSSFAQFTKMKESKYYMDFEPVIGSLSGSSDISNGINPNQTLKSKGFLYGIDWVSARWVDVDGVWVPKLQIPMRFRTMRAANNKGLSTSDGTVFPEEASSDPKDKPTSPFTYFDFSIDLYYSPFCFKKGSVIITPKFGLGVDIGHHSYNLDVSKFIGKEGTYTNLQTEIDASYSSFYSYTFWEDLYGINLGTYVNLGNRLLFDAGWEYYPGRLMTKAMGNTINSIWNARVGTGKSKSSKLSRFSVEAQYRIKSWFSAFIKYENSNYQFEGPIYNSDQKFYQKYSNILFGITLGGPKLEN
jgi:hypothetical protein